MGERYFGGFKWLNQAVNGAPGLGRFPFDGGHCEEPFDTLLASLGHIANSL